MEADALPLAGAERPGFVPDRVGDPEPAKVVNEPRASQRPDLWLRQPETCAGVCDEVRDGVGMAEGVGRLQVDEVGDREQRVIKLLA